MSKRDGLEYHISDTIWGDQTILTLICPKTNGVLGRAISLKVGDFLLSPLTQYQTTRNGRFVAAFGGETMEVTYVERTRNGRQIVGVFRGVDRTEAMAWGAGSIFYSQTQETHNER